MNIGHVARIQMNEMVRKLCRYLEGTFSKQKKEKLKRSQIKHVLRLLVADNECGSKGQDHGTLF